MTDPYLGAPVHFAAEPAPLNEYPASCHMGLVMEIDPANPDRVGLVTFAGHTGMVMRPLVAGGSTCEHQVAEDPQLQTFGTWHWAEDHKPAEDADSGGGSGGADDPTTTGEN